MRGRGGKREWNRGEGGREERSGEEEEEGTHHDSKQRSKHDNITRQESS
jgi:hypothetical protein